MSDEKSIDRSATQVVSPSAETPGGGMRDPSAVLVGPEVIASHLKTLPAAPGVYRMLDRDGEVIYVGKARSLKARVSNYARLGGHSNRIARMISRTASMEFVRVNTEAEALLLEANLIKRFRPRFNVLMRDDKSFPYILIADTNDAPQIVKHRGARNRKGEFFGPFASAGAVDRTINMLQRAFLLRTCSDSVFESRTRPCLLYQIKRCAGPCTGEISPGEYRNLVAEATRFLRGESQNVRRMYQDLMEQAAARMEYEEAAKYRNRLWALAHVTSEQAINAQAVEEADVFATHQEGGQTCIQVFFFRSGQNWGNRAYFPKADRTLEAADVLESFIAQFYDDKPVPKLILLSHNVPTRELLAEALSIKAARKVSIQTPKRGDKVALVEHAHQNAREALGRRLAESSSQRILLQGLAERFGLISTPRRVEVYDNSHISGTNAVGAMIVAGPEGLIKNQYRKFNIKSDAIAPGDDYAMMREVLTRRFRRLLTEHPPPEETATAEIILDAASEELQSGDQRSDKIPEIASDRVKASRIEEPSIPPLNRRGSDGMPFTTVPADEVQPSAAEIEEDTDLFAETPSWPDLVLVDGGAGQLSVAREVFEELGVTDVALVGIAKGPDRDAGREHFHRIGHQRPIMLEPRDPVLYFVQRLRDEAHRFAIGTHRAKRSKAIAANPLDEIPGVGPTRKRALLAHFGSAKAASRAGVEDLKDVPGISAEMAQKIYDFFHEKRS
ncbi:MAG: excinuclease ABC subunit UvrC [Hyphomicrobiaceae bacterium]